MPKADHYTMAQAAARMGVTEAAVRDMVRRQKLRLIGTHPQLVDGAQVDARRAEILSKFSDVADLDDTPGGLVAPRRRSAMDALRVARAIEAARELADGGIERINQAQRLFAEVALNAVDQTGSQGEDPARPR